jgi:endonuclease/exonuclease/phosphatase family metal-dependent hydrolase
MVGRTQTPTSINGNRGDQIWLHGSAGNRLLGYDVIDIADMETGVSGKTYLSDHLPLWIDLEMEEQ